MESDDGMWPANMCIWSFLMTRVDPLFFQLPVLCVCFISFSDSLAETPFH